MANYARLNDLETQLAYVRWRRNQQQHHFNALSQQTKSMKKEDTIQCIIDQYRVFESSDSVQRSVSDEYSKPLLLTKSQILSMRKSDAAKLDRNLLASTKSLKRLRDLKANLSKAQSSKIEGKAIESMIDKIEGIEKSVTTQMQIRKNQSVDYEKSISAASIRLAKSKYEITRGNVIPLSFEL